MADSQDVQQPAVQETAAPAPSTEENKAPEPQVEAPKESKQEKADPILEVFKGEPEQSDKPKAEKKPKAEPKAKAEEPAKETEQPDESQTEGKPADEPQSPKSENRFQKLANENRDLKEQLAQLSQQDKQLEAEQKLLEGEDPETGQPYSAEDAARIARYQTIEQQREQNQWLQHQLSLSAESAQIINDNPIFNPSSPEFKPALAAKAAAAIEPYLIRDPNIPEIDPSTGQPTGRGQIIGSNVSPSAIYQPIADAYEMSRAEGQIAGQRNAEKMMANADPSTSAGPVKSKEDPVLAVFTSDD